MAGLLPHELVHAWNGKYRRPATLTDADYARPIDSSLLWVYEGLTTYLGDVLTVRSGLWTEEEYRESLALDTAAMEHRAGRAWRPLADTAVAAQALFDARGDGANWRRDVDFYAEGALIWLDADVTIRRATGGRRTLDDFCQRFFGGTRGGPEVRPYGLDDVVAALDEVARHDWRRFFEERIERPAPQPPTGGITASGWKLVYTDEPPEMLESIERVDDVTDVQHSIGLLLDDEGRVRDTVPGLAADRAGVGPGMRLVAVNGRVFDTDVLREALRATRQGVAIELLVENAGRIGSHTLDYRGGERYLQLVRDESLPDLLSRILEPRVAAPEAAD
jgi:predicted metalloprotease with PDZ domain